MSKISELSNGGALLSTDDLIVVRSGGNVRAQLSSLDGIAIGSSTPAAGAFTSVSVDSITIDGTEIDSTGDLFLDAVGDITIDADGGDIRLSDAGTQFGKFTRSSGDFIISSSENNKDMKFAGADGGADITALTLDMSEAGAATFNAGAIFNDHVGVGSVMHSWTAFDGVAQIGRTGAIANYDGGAGVSNQQTVVASNTYYGSGGYKAIEGAANAAYMNIASGQIYFAFAPAVSAGSAQTFTRTATIDTSGNFLVGATTTTNLSDGTGNDGVQLNPSGTVAAARTSNVTAVFNRLSSDGEIVRFNKDGTTVGSIGTRSGSNLYLTFRTEANGDGCGLTGSADSTGSILPASGDGGPQDNHIEWGSASFRFKNIYAANGTIQTSDRNQKQDIEDLSEAEKKVAVAAKSLIKKFRFKSSVEEKGETARIHVGIIAQELQAAFEAEGLDASRYGMFCSDTWTDDDGNEQTRLGVRYSELLAFIISAI